MALLTERKYTGGIGSGTSLPRVPDVNVGLPEDASGTGATVIAAYGGRIFYSGMDAQVDAGDKLSPRYNAFIFFSPSLDNVNKLTRCYQEADPTSEHISDLIDSDGGFIPISEMGKCVNMTPIGNALMVFADNGVWEILGGTNGFSATSFNVRKVSDVGTTSGDSVVPVESFIMYWADGGIYIIVPDEASGQYQSVNITEQSIQTFYNDIDNFAKDTTRGVFDSRSRQVRWMYNDTNTYDGVTNRNAYTRELVFDTVLKAFYPSTINSLNETPFISDYVETPGLISIDAVYNIVIGPDQVVVGLDTVIHTAQAPSSVATETKYFTIQNITNGNQFYTFSAFNNVSFLDWFKADSIGTDAPAFLVTGYELFEDTQRNKQVTYLTTHFTRTEDGWEFDDNLELIPTNQSACTVQAQWEWTNSANAGRWGTPFSAYRLKRYYQPEDVNDPFDYSFTVVSNKSKLRGKGAALSLRFDTTAGKNCRLLGWAVNATGETHV